MVNPLKLVCGRYCLLLVLFMLPAMVQAQRPASAVVHLKNGDVAMPGAKMRSLERISENINESEPKQVLLHFDELPTQQQKDELMRNGVQLLDYIPDNTYSAIVRVNLAQLRIAGLPAYSALAMKPEWKADAYLWGKAQGKGSLSVLVSVAPGITATQMQMLAASIGGEVRHSAMQQHGHYAIVVPAGKLRNLADWYGVRYVSPDGERVPLDLQSRPVVKGNIAVAQPEYGGYGLNGDSVTVGVGDNTSGIFHADIRDRIVNFNPAGRTNHGIHINGIAGGAAIVDPMAASISPRVKLVNYYFDLLLPATGAMYHDHNMTVTNNSYSVIAGSCDYSGTYDGYSFFLDTLAVQYPDVLQVFASGNDGYMNCPPYVPGFRTVAGGYQPAKNNVVVGSLQKHVQQAVDMSRGPTQDGRLKPEIVAVGVNVYSSVRVDEYVSAGGTSMASPHVAGGAAVLTQHYKRKYGVQPKADVLKTLLLNGAMDLGNPGPDFTYGFGSMDLSRSLKMVDNDAFKTGTITNGTEQTYTLTVPANTAQVKVMLYWHDVPAGPASGKQLVNDLDVTVSAASGGTFKPLILDPTPANVTAIAKEGEDHLNNVEQVTINNPSAGTYTIRVKGYAIPAGTQRYVVAYDIIPKGLQLTFPLGGEQLYNHDTIRVFWNSVGDSSTYKVEFSRDNGMVWTTINDAVPADTRHCPFVATNINAGNCIVRVTKNSTGESVTSARFAVTSPPQVRLDERQCPGYVNIHWSKITNASAYIMLKKVGAFMQVVDTVTDTTYSFGGLPLNEKAYVAIQPIVHGMPGYRSVAAIRTPNTGDCTHLASAGDIMVDKIVSPLSGRMFTSTQFGSTYTLQVRVRNLYNAATSNYTLFYRVNGGAWLSAINPGTIPANGTTVVGIAGLPFAGVGSYDVEVAVTNMDVPDPYQSNDTVRTRIKNLPNEPLNLATPYEDGFEDMPAFAVTHDSTGVSPNGRWDYFNTNDSGRMRSYVNEDITITGNRSVSLDEWIAVKYGSNNAFAGTFNLSAYDTGAAEVRVDFNYILHSIPKKQEGNIVYARGNDIAPWFPLYSFYADELYAGQVNKVRSRSLTDAVRLGGYNFSGSSQISFWHNDTSLIAARNYGNGLTIDNVRVYTVQNDAQLVRVVFPLISNCGLPASVPLTVQVYNGVNYTLYNVSVHYRMDNSSMVYTGVIDSIRGKDTVDFTFATPMNVSAGGTHVLHMWLAAPGDTYPANDSILNYSFRNSVIVSSFPYLQNFENGDGGFYTSGTNSSWQYGTPATTKINRAASGAKAWKTNLTGRYRNMERSYLYSPCYDIANLQQPMLSFSAALDVENCGDILCDAAYVEYSFDGRSWAKLGSAKQGTNWYDSSFNVWSTTGFTRWHVASIPLPQPPAGGSIRFRFVLVTDPGATFDGMAVDDVHIYDRANGIAAAEGIKVATKDAIAGQWNDVLYNHELLASVRPTRNLTMEATLYEQQQITNPSATQYTLSRSYQLKPGSAATDSNLTRLYLTDAEVARAATDEQCLSCTPVADAYSLGITRYTNSNNAAALNGSLADDTGGVFSYLPYQRVQWVPYDNGYYAQFPTAGNAEYWFNNGGPTGNFPAGVDYLNFIAFKAGDKVTTYWHSLIDTAVNKYTLERSDDSTAFYKLLDTAAVRRVPGEYSFTDPEPLATGGTRYYRLKWTMTNSDAEHYSPVRRVRDADSAANLVQLDARMVNASEVLVSWTSFIDGLADHYVLERAIGSGGFVTITTEQSVKRYGQQYYYTDRPGEHIRQNTPIHYRLTVVFANGQKVTLPVRTIIWIDENAVAGVFPNPTYDGRFTVNWFARAGATMELVVTNTIGQTVLTGSATASGWNNSTALQLPVLAKGMYLVRMSIDGKQYIARLVYE